MIEKEDTLARLSLDELAIWHGTDKSSKVHGYTSAYELYFAPLRHDLINLLEIGVGCGGSLRMWRDYFPRARVFGLDVEDCPALAGVDVTLFRGSQSDQEVLHKLAKETGGCDIVIDDGSHLWSDQVFTFQTLFPHIRPGGCYVVEDLHTSYWDSYRAGDKRPIEFFMALVHEINTNGESGYGRIENDPKYGSLADRLTVFQRTVESINFYKSVVFVKKKAVTAGGPAA